MRHLSVYGASFPRSVFRGKFCVVSLPCTQAYTKTKRKSSGYNRRSNDRVIANQIGAWYNFATGALRLSALHTIPPDAFWRAFLCPNRNAADRVVPFGGVFALVLPPRGAGRLGLLYVVSFAHTRRAVARRHMLCVSSPVALRALNPLAARRSLPSVCHRLTLAFVSAAPRALLSVYKYTTFNTASQVFFFGPRQPVVSHHFPCHFSRNRGICPLR